MKGFLNKVTKPSSSPTPSPSTSSPTSTIPNTTSSPRSQAREENKAIMDPSIARPVEGTPRADISLPRKQDKR